MNEEYNKVNVKLLSILAYIGPLFLMGKLSVEGAGGLCASDMLFSMPLHGRKHNSEGSQEKKEQKGNDDQENMAELNPLPEDYQQNGDEKAQS